MGRPSLLWSDRWAAGLELVPRLGRWAHQPQTTTVIGLPRGGVAVGAAVASELGLPLATWSVRKLSLPAAPEYAFGALAAADAAVWNPDALAVAHLTLAQRQELVAAARPELERRRLRFGDPSPASLKGRNLIVVDDGIATGMSVRAALMALHQAQPAALILAVPVVDQRLVAVLSSEVDALITVAIVSGLQSVGSFYRDFDQLCDDDVEQYLDAARTRLQASARV